MEADCIRTFGCILVESIGMDCFFYMTRDMEMSCDEAVLAQFGNQIKKDTAHLYLLLRWSGIRIHLPRLRLERQMQEGELRTC